MLQMYIGLRFEYLKKYKFLLIYSPINLMMFSLFRIDGVHVTSGSGFSKLLETLNIDYTYNGNDNFHIKTSICFFIIQLIINSFLFLKTRKEAVTQ